jgi:uncharacterized protein YecT (DUF1311 family)
MIVLLPLLAQALAAPVPQCAEPVTQAEMTACAGQDYLRADAALNAQWEQTATHVRQRDTMYDHSHEDRPGFHERLLSAQRAWLAFRDAHCATEGDLARGGSLEPMMIAHCKAQLTQERTRQLRAIAEWAEGTQG